MNKNLHSLLCLLLLFVCSGVYGQNTDYTVIPDTLFFVEPDDFVFGKEFTICNTQPDTLYIQHMDQFGFMNCYCAPWYVDPYIPSFPLLLGPGDSLTRTVRFYAVDYPYSDGMVYDSLFIISPGDTSWIILAADSIHIWIGTEVLNQLKTEVFPNPFRENLTISLSAIRPCDAVIRVMDVTQRTIKTFGETHLTYSENMLKWDGTDDFHHPVPIGMYFLEIRTSEVAKIIKILKN